MGFVGGAEKEEGTVLQIEPSLASHNKHKKEFMKRQKDIKCIKRLYRDVIIQHTKG